MSRVSHTPDLARIAERAFTEVLATFLSLSAIPQPPSDQHLAADAPDLFTATVLLSGARLSGSVQIQLPSGFIAQAVEHLTGLQGAGGEALWQDTTGEIANMVAGRVAVHLAAEGYPCALGTPSASRRALSPVETQPGTDRGRTDLVCNGHCLSLHIECLYTAR